MEGRIVGWVMRATGFLLVGCAMAGWLTLATWSAHDPSLTHTTGGTVRNWLGPLGAVVSDLLLQTLGFAAIFAFLGLAAAGLELRSNEWLARAKLRMMIYPFVLVALAGAFSALPTPGSWPLVYGVGGIVGDAVHGFAAGAFATLDPQRSGLYAGVLLFALGMCLLSTSLGLTPRNWRRLFERQPAHHWQRGMAVLGAMMQPMQPSLSAMPRGREPQARIPEYAPEPRWQGADARREPTLGPQPVATLAMPHETGQPMAPLDEPPPYDDPLPLPAFLTRGGPTVARSASPPEMSPRDAEFDADTERDTRSMANRFAPKPPVTTSARKAQVRRGLLPTRAPASTWKRPSLNLLKRAPVVRQSAEVAGPVLRGNARLLEDVLADFGVKGEVKAIRPGPVVTLFELEPVRGTKAARVVALADDIARSMSAASARIAAVPGRNTIGIELPNVRREAVHLRELLDAEAWRTIDARLPVALGKSIGGEPIIADLARMPHLLVAGTTGSGKSVGLNAMILSLLYRLAPSECRLLMIDPKMLELSAYNGVPHLLAPVITDAARATQALRWAVGEMEERLKRMAELGVRNIDVYNTRIRSAHKRGEVITRTVQTGFDERTGAPLYEREALDLEPMPYIVIVVDELADLMAVAGKDVEGSIQRLAQMARAAGMHLVVATQRPSVDVITGTIKANFPTRIAFRVASKIDSRTIIDEQGAEHLLGAGDMLYATGAGQTVRVHGPFVSDEEVEQVAAALRQQAEPVFATSLVEALEAPPDKGDAAPSRPASSEEDLYDRAVAIVHRDQKASISYLQRRLGIGYNRAADLIERMQRDGLVSAPDGAGRRRIAMDDEEAAPSPYERS